MLKIVILITLLIAFVLDIFPFIILNVDGAFVNQQYLIQSNDWIGSPT